MKELQGIDPTLPTYEETYEVMSDIARMHQAEADALRDNQYYLRFVGSAANRQAVQGPQTNTNHRLNLNSIRPQVTGR